MTSSRSSDVQVCGQAAGPTASSVPGSAGRVRAVNHSSSTRTPPDSNSQASGGTGEMRPSPSSSASSSRS